TTRGRGSGDGHGGSRCHAELLLELLQQLTQLEDGHAGDRVEDLFLRCHHASPSGSAFSAVSVTPGSAAASTTGSAAASASGSAAASTSGSAAASTSGSAASGSAASGSAA